METEGVTTTTFGVIHRDIGVMQQFLHVAAIFGKDADADAGADT